MSMKPSSRPVAWDFLPSYRWIAPIIAVLIFMFAQDGNASAAPQFQQSGFGFHATVGIFSLFAGALFGVPVTAVVRTAWHLAFGE